MLYTSLLLQMWHGLAAAQVPGWSRSPRAWRRSWLLGFTSAVVSRVRAAEHQVISQATAPGAAGERTALVLADRSQVITRNIEHAYPVTRKTRVTYSGSGTGPVTPRGRRRTSGRPGCAPGPGARSAAPGNRLHPAAREPPRCAAPLGTAFTAATAARLRAYPAPQAAAEQGQENRVGAVPVRPELRVPAARLRAAQARHLGQHGGRVQHLDVIPAARARRPARPGSPPGAGSRSRRPPPRPAGPRPGAAQQAALQPGQRRDVRGVTCASGPRGGGAARRARSTGTSASTRSNDPGRQAGLVPSAATTAAAAPVTGTASRASRARCGRTSAASSRAPRCAASPASSRALPPGPAHMSSHAAVRPGHLDPGQRDRGKLAGLVLHRRAPLADRRDRAPDPRCRDTRRTPTTGPAAAPSATSSAGSASPGTAHSVTRGRTPSAASAASVSAQRRRPGPRRARRPAPPPSQRGWLYRTARWPSGSASRAGRPPRSRSPGPGWPPCGAPR